MIILIILYIFVDGRRKLGYLGRINYHFKRLSYINISVLSYYNYAPLYIVWVVMPSVFLIYPNWVLCSPEETTNCGSQFQPNISFCSALLFLVLVNFLSILLLSTTMSLFLLSSQIRFSCLPTLTLSRRLVTYFIKNLRGYGTILQ